MQICRFTYRLNEKIILKLIGSKDIFEMRLDYFGSRERIMAYLFEHGITCGNTYNIVY
jgi:3-dehydroquinate dehydratase